MNYLTKTQLAIIVFFVPLVFKMAMLPSMLYEACGPDSYIGIAIITTVEFLQMGLVLFIVSKGGMEGIGSLYGTNVQRLIAAPLIFVMSVKSLVFITEIQTYVCDYLFYNISSFPIICAIMVVIFYLALKGVKTIGRIFELSIWFIPLIFLFGILFGKARLQPEYLGPLFADGPSELFGGLNKYIIYTFDFSPLLFFKIEKGKNARIVIASVLAVIAVCGCYMILIASYGRATFLVNDAFARLASFNTVVSEIGSLDWPSAMLWLTTSICNVALKFAAMAEILKYFNVKKAFGAGSLCVVVGGLLIFLFRGFKEALRLTVHPIRFIVIGIEIAVPIILLILYAVKNRKGVTLETPA